MNEVFADTSYWVALFSRTDSAHGAAVAAGKALQPLRIITSQMILVELMAFKGFRSPPLREPLAAFVDRILTDPNVVVKPQTARLFEDALALFRKYKDKEWSLVDCSTVHLMHERGLTRVLSTDEHFVQAGFEALLREPRD